MMNEEISRGGLNRYLGEFEERKRKQSRYNMIKGARILPAMGTTSKD